LVDHNYDQNILVSLSNVKPEKNTLDLPLILEGSWKGGEFLILRVAAKSDRSLRTAPATGHPDVVFGLGEDRGHPESAGETGTEQEVRFRLDSTEVKSSTG